MFHSHFLVIFDNLLYRKSEPKLPDSMDDESLANGFLIILLKRSPQYAKSCRKEVLQITPKLSCGTVAPSLITSSQYHMMNSLIWFLDRL